MTTRYVSFISSPGVSRTATVKMRMCKLKTLNNYTQEYFMGGVDNTDKDKKIEGSMTLFCKFYKMVVHGVFYFMVVNGQVAWIYL